MKIIAKNLVLLVLIVSAGLGIRLSPAAGEIGNIGLNTGAKAPEIVSPVWLNSAPLRLADLKGKVVMVEFWTFGCSNCRNVEPYVKQWHDKYTAQGLTVIGVHTPEFAHESKVENVKRYIAEHGIRHAVALDNDFSIWNSYRNRFWPAFYLIDKRGIIRYTHIGEGRYAVTERQIQTLLAER